jgi:tetratricopeptide (TPR) repeat protein
VSGSYPSSLAAALRAELQAIAELLEGSPDKDTRDALKRRIVRLFKSVDATLAELTQIKEDIRSLVNRYKQLRADAAGAQLHADHLGASTFIEKAWSLISAGKAEAAIQTLGRALELSPGNVQAQSLLGWAELQSGREADALATFSRVLAQEPANALARMNVGYLRLKQRAFGEAIEQLSRVIRLDNDRKATLYAHYYLGLVYLERGMLADAQAFLAKAIALGPNLIEAYHDLGRAQWLAGQHEAARATWTTGAASSQLSPWARRCQEQLDRVTRGEEVPRSTSS